MTTTTDLAARVEQANTPQRARSGVAGLVEQMGPQFARALPAHIPAERFVRLALTALRSNPALQRCTPESFLGALMTCAQLGLEPNTPLGEAYLIPYGRDCTFVPGYQGLAKLSWNSDQIETMLVQQVHEKDDFDFALGDDPHIHHRPYLGDDPGPVTRIYAIVRLKSGGVLREVWSMSKVKKHQAAHSKNRSAKAPADVAGWMDRKVVLKQALKLAPKATELAQALANDGAVRTDLSLDAVDLIEGEAFEEPTDAELIEDEEPTP